MKLLRKIGWRRGLAGIVLAILAGIGAADRIVARKVDQILHPPRVGAAEITDADGSLIPQIRIRTADGLALAAWHLPSQNGATVILQHGYRAGAAQMLPVGRMLAGHGYGILWLDFRGHGQSGGGEVTFGLREVMDTRSAVDYLAGLPDSGPIGVLGNSMGGATAILAAAEDGRIRAIVAEGSFAELEDEVGVGIRIQASLPAWPLSHIFIACAERQTGFRIEEISPARAIGKISPRPVLILQGGSDERIPVDSGQRLCDAAGEPKDLWISPEAGHVAIFRTSPGEYERRVVAFFDRHLLDR